jgi:hypothetical protein
MKNKKKLIEIFSKLITIILIFFAVFYNIWVIQNIVYCINFLVLLNGLHIIFCRDDAKSFYKNSQNLISSKIVYNAYTWIVILMFGSMAWFGSAFVWFLTWSAKETFLAETSEDKNI